MAVFGTSEHAVKTQIWIAVTDYLLVAIVQGGASNYLPRSMKRYKS